MRRQAALALAERGYPDGLEVLIEATAAGHPFEERQAATAALGTLGDARAVPALVQLLRDVRLRRFAVGALGRIGDRRAVEPLLALLRGDRFISVREAAARALGEIGDRRVATRLVALLAGERERPVVAELLATLARLEALPRGAAQGGDLWLVLRAERAGPARVSSGGADLAVLQVRAGLGAYLLENVPAATRISVADATLLGSWAPQQTLQRKVLTKEEAPASRR
jgi:HEAT repeat protein